MDISSISPSASQMKLQKTDAKAAEALKLQAADNKQDKKLRQAFDSFVGETFYGQLLSQMRKTVEKSPYFNGGRGEEIFQGQLDQQLAAGMAKANAHTFSGPMYELFALSQK